MMNEDVVARYLNGGVYNRPRIPSTYTNCVIYPLAAGIREIMPASSSLNSGRDRTFTVLIATTAWSVRHTTPREHTRPLTFPSASAFKCPNRSISSICLICSGSSHATCSTSSPLFLRNNLLYHPFSTLSLCQYRSSSTSFMNALPPSQSLDPRNTKASSSNSAAGDIDIAARRAGVVLMARAMCRCGEGRWSVDELG